MLNKVQFIGHLGKDPEQRFLPNGTPVANFSVAATEKWRDKQTGEQREETEWLRCSAFDKLAEVCAEWLKQGQLVYVEGALKTRKYTGNDGVERYSTECRLTTMKMLGGRRDDGGAPRPAASKPAGAGGIGGAAPAPGGSSFADFEDDIPF